jgi:hypothetical protein
VVASGDEAGFVIDAATTFGAHGDAHAHPERTTVDEPSELDLLFHRLNNQLGIVLANAELLEAKLADDVSRSRAGQVVASALDALATTKDIRARLRS